MTLFTGMGDNGTTKTLSSDKRISKRSATAEALGTLDEVNSFLGLCKILSKKANFEVNGESFEKITHEIQENLFIVQAELAGAPKKIEIEKVTKTEELIKTIEKSLPPIKTFFISGGSQLAALFDIARTIARRAERRVVAVNEILKESGQEIAPDTMAYLNRLSSLLYALARLSNHLSGINEEPPSYK